MKFIFYLSTLYSIITVVDFGDSYKTIVKGLNLDLKKGKLIINTNGDYDTEIKKLTNIKCLSFGYENDYEALKEEVKGTIFENCVNNESGTFISFNVKDFTFEDNKTYSLEFEEKISGNKISLDIEVCNLEQLEIDPDDIDSTDSTIKENVHSKDCNPEDVTSCKKNKIEALHEEDSNSVSSSILSKISSLSKCMSRKVSKGTKKDTSSTKKNKISKNTRKRNSKPSTYSSSQVEKSEYYEYFFVSLAITLIFAFIIFLLCCVPTMSFVKSLFQKA